MTQAAMAGPRPTGREVVMRVQGISKEYRLYDSPRARLRALLTGRSTHRSHWALREVSFTLHKGECIGVIGDNGAGKSSLLKLLAGTMRPTQGSIDCDGRVTAILELGAGFHPEFTGRDNLYFAGSLIGINQTQMRELESGITEFAQLGEALDRPVKTYSSGMVVRLAFALVTAVRPDVLIVDEALAVGDQNFQKKCIDRITEFRKQGCTILFCLHSPYHVRQLCERALWLVKGRVQALGETESVLAAYEANVRAAQAQAEAELSVASAQAAGVVAPAAAACVEGDVAHLLQPEVQDLEPGASAAGVRQLRTRTLEVLLHAKAPAGMTPSFGFMIEQDQGVGITSVAMHVDKVEAHELEPGLWGVKLVFPDLPLHSGDYMLSAFLFDTSGLMVLDEMLHFQAVRVISEQPLPGLVHLPHYWERP